MKSRLSRLHLSTQRFVGLFALPLALGLCAFQYGDRNGLNNMPFAKIRPLVSRLAEAQKLADQGTIDLFAGQAVGTQAVTLRGELTDANCFLSTHTHAYDHAFCAKLCAAAGSSLVFIPDQDQQVYVVLTGKNAVPLPNHLLDRMGVPGIVITGRTLNAEGMHALAIDTLEQ